VSVEKLFEDALALPHRDKLRLHSLLGECLPEIGAAATISDRRIERQQQALTAMAEVARALDLPESQAPTATQFNETSKLLGLRWSVSSVGRVFNSWRNATQAFAGGQIPEGSRQIRLRQHMRGPHRTKAANLDSVRAWLASGPVEETPTDYNRWRRRHNDSLAGTDTSLAVHWMGVRRSMPGLGVAEIVAAARQEIPDIKAYCKDRAEERLAVEDNPAGLVDLPDAAALLGMTPVIVLQKARIRRDFPNLVVKLGHKSFLYLSDVRAYADGIRQPTLAEDALSGSLLTMEQLAGELGFRKSSLWRFIEAKQDWRVPAPCGSASEWYYWFRENVDRWKAEHPPETRVRRLAEARTTSSETGGHADPR